MDFDDPIIFKQSPTIPPGLSAVVRYKLEAKEYKNRISAIGSIAIEIIATLLIIGLLWITVDWVRVAVTAIAILLGLVLLISLRYVL